MRFGFFVMPFHAPDESPTLTLENDLAMVARAEALGFDEFWIGEHHSGGWETVPSPEIFIAAASQRTSTIRLGSAVINLPYHHPFHVTERFSFLDQITNGRTMLGVGPGAFDNAFFGIRPEDSKPMADEALAVIHRLLREDEPVTHQGRYWQFKDLHVQVRSLQQPHLPVAVITTGSGHGAAVAAEHDCRYVTGNFFEGDPAMFRRHWEQYAAEMGTRGKLARRENWSIVRDVYLADTTERAFAELKAGAELKNDRYMSVIFGRVMPNHNLPPGTGVRSIAQKRGWIVGDPAECIRQLREYESVTGGFGGFLMVPPAPVSDEQWNHSMELFARHVMPEFRGTLPPLRTAYERLVRGT